MNTNKTKFDIAYSFVRQQYKIITSSYYEEYEDDHAIEISNAINKLIAINPMGNAALDCFYHDCKQVYQLTTNERGEDE